MNSLTYFIGPVLALALLVLVLTALLQKRLRERHALWWVIGAIVALALSVFPGLLETVSHSIGIAVPLNLVFILAFAVIFLVSLQHSSELTRLEEKVRTLAEHVAELEMPGSAAHSHPNEHDER